MSQITVNLDELSKQMESVSTALQDSDSRELAKVGELIQTWADLMQRLGGELEGVLSTADNEQVEINKSALRAVQAAAGYKPDEA